jgi:hypothetical protein
VWTNEKYYILRTHYRVRTCILHLASSLIANNDFKRLRRNSYVGVGLIRCLMHKIKYTWYILHYDTDCLPSIHAHLHCYFLHFCQFWCDQDCRFCFYVRLIQWLYSLSLDIRSETLVWILQIVVINKISHNTFFPSNCLKINYEDDFFAAIQVVWQIPGLAPWRETQKNARRTV